MSNARTQDFATKLVVTVAEMARMVGLSRARFYQLQREGVFPLPTYAITSRRPLYTEEQQTAILEARRRNMGVNGQPVLFYARRAIGSPEPTRRPRIVPAQRGGSESTQRIIDALKGLGMDRVSPREVDAAVAALFPNVVANIDEGEIIRAVFLHLRRQNSANNHGR